LTSTDRLNIEASRATVSEDLRGALARYDRILRDKPADIAALTNGGITLGMLGRFREALQYHRRAGEASPYGPSEIVWINQVVDLFSLGRTDEARKAAQNLHGSLAPFLSTDIEIAANNWEGAESIAVAALAEPNLDEDQRGMLLLNLGSAQAGRGALEAAAKTFEQAEEVSQGISAPTQDMARRARLMLAIVSGGAIPLSADTRARDHSTAALITRGLRAAIAGDASGARRRWNEARAGSRLELVRQGAAPALLEARIHALSGQWGEAARVLQPVASQPLEFGGGWYPAGMSAVRWLLADAFEKLGHPDSAAIYLEKIVSDPAPTIQESHLRGIVWPFAHRRLVILYAHMGRIEDARRHWRILNGAFTRPDRELRPLIDEARAALAKAEEALPRPRQTNAKGT
jgi:tetratricopeptide (TPR) repeat protein